MARPTKLNDELIIKAREYVAENSPFSHPFIPTIEGLALELGISRETVYDWESNGNSQEFSDIVSDLRAAQGQKLIQNALNGKYNASIAKLILSGKHDYIEKRSEDITSGGEKLEGLVIVQHDKD